MDDKEPKTEEAPASLQPGPAGASLRPGLVEAQKVTSNDKNKTKPIRDPGRVIAARKFSEHNSGMAPSEPGQRLALLL